MSSYLTWLSLQRIVSETAKIKSLHFWLESVCSHVTSSTPILLVGTHTGNMERATMERINDNLKRNFWKFFLWWAGCKQSGWVGFFPVENSLGQNDGGIHTFQRVIIATAEELKETIGQNIPLSGCPHQYEEWQGSESLCEVWGVSYVLYLTISFVPTGLKIHWNTSMWRVLWCTSTKNQRGFCLILLY